MLISATFLSCRTEIEDFYDSGAIELRYEVDDNNVPNGPFIQYYENGNIKAKSTFSDGEIDGQMKSFYSSGELKEITYLSNGLKIDSALQFYKSGVLNKVTYFDQGIKNGIYRQYSERGSLICEANYKEDLLNGHTVTYFENGNRSLWAMMRDDSLISSIDYDSLIENKIVREYRVMEISSISDKYKVGDSIHILFGVLGPEKDDKTRNYYNIVNSLQPSICIKEIEVQNDNKSAVLWIADSAGFYEINCYSKVNGNIYSEYRTFAVGDPQRVNNIQIFNDNDDCEYHYDGFLNDIFRGNLKLPK